MKERFERGYSVSDTGIHCPVCGGRMARRSLVCRHCRRSGRLQIDESKVQAVRKDIFLPRAMTS